MIKTLKMFFAFCGEEDRRKLYLAIALGVVKAIFAALRITAIAVVVQGLIDENMTMRHFWLALGIMAVSDLKLAFRKPHLSPDCLRRRIITDITKMPVRTGREKYCGCSKERSVKTAASRSAAGKIRKPSVHPMKRSAAAFRLRSPKRTGMISPGSRDKCGQISISMLRFLKPGTSPQLPAYLPFQQIC